jgi:dTDP-glucose pyrophosphorylase
MTSATWKSTFLPRTSNVQEAIQSINDTAQQICLIVDDDECLLGTITDGDIRRGLLRGVAMDDGVSTVMNGNPVVAAGGISNDGLLQQMTAHRLRQVPLVDAKNRILGLSHLHDLIMPSSDRDNWVVLMAGGLGTRLRPLTDTVPKPLVQVGNKPLLETIIENFAQQNFRKFYISVNYKANAIKQHFGGGEKWGVEIRYLEEQTRLGTAGALRLMDNRPKLPMIVMNGDLLTRVNFCDLLDYHNDHHSKATMCVREYDFQVPFGVVEIEGNQIRKIDEKPIHRFFVNAGIYVLDPELIDRIPANEPFDMTDLFDGLIKEREPTAAFPIHEYWLDIGKIEDLHRANIEIEKINKP